MPMSRIKHILFDNDGVLVDTEYLAAIRMTATLNKMGVDLDADYYLNHHTGTTFSGILNHYFADTLTREDKLKIAHQVDAEVAAAVKVVPGIEQVLQLIQLPKSVVSNSSIATVQYGLQTTGLERFFDDRIFSSEQVDHPKPAPDLYLFAIRSLSLKPEELLVVEDSLTGAEAALTAGLQVIGFCGASHIVQGHEKKLLDLGVSEVAKDVLYLQEVLQQRFLC